MQNLTAKLLNENLKKGWTAEDFCKYLGGISEEKFFSALNKKFSYKYVQAICQQLKRNQKIRKKTNQNRSSNTEVTTENDPNIVELDPSENKDSESDSNELASDQNTEIEISKLESEEQFLQKCIYNAEIHLKALHEKKNGFRSKLETLNKKIAELINLATSYSEIISDISNELNSLSSKISETNSDISEKSKRLSTVRDQIQKMKSITIYVYSNGVIDIENADISIPDEWSDLWTKLMKIESLESLTVKNIKTLAKLICLSKTLEQKNIQFEIICESDEIESHLIDLISTT